MSVSSEGGGSSRASSSPSSSSGHELVWGFGLARCALPLSPSDGSAAGCRVVNGPLLEVRAEAELAPDGSLLVRPRTHGGVSLNREVMAALASSRGGGGTDAASRLSRAAEDMEAGAISPAWPETYAGALRRIAVEMHPNGRFVPLAGGRGGGGSGGGGGGDGLVVTDAWCLYRRPRPSAVWARDARALADLLRSAAPGGGGGGGGADPPRAALALTHGPGALESASARAGAVETAPPIPAIGVLGSLRRLLWDGSGESAEAADGSGGGVGGRKRRGPLFPLPSSAAQRRVAELLDGGAAAVVVEGPPGCGKTHSIANIVCSQLARGRRVLVTSKGAPALSVLRDRLPEGVRELCVDVTAGEAEGMRQLQRAVERLADRVSGSAAAAAGGSGEEICRSLENSIQELEEEIASIDETLRASHERRRALLRTAGGQELSDSALSVSRSHPFVSSALASWSLDEARSLSDGVDALEVRAGDPLLLVAGYDLPPADDLLAAVAARAGATAGGPSSRAPPLAGGLGRAAARALASVPILGDATGARERMDRTEEALGGIRMGGGGAGAGAEGAPPRTEADWGTVLRAMRRDRDWRRLHLGPISDMVRAGVWPRDAVYDDGDGGERRPTFRPGFVESLRRAVRAKELVRDLSLDGVAEEATSNRSLEARRGRLVAKVRPLSENLVQASVAARMGAMFSPDAQSALIKFSQLAGRTRFRTGSQNPRLTQRQQRHRREYLDAFDRCVRHVPCWILTQSQICDYLPPEFGLFDLVVIDEASQSDVSALPALLRGKRWLIVGDGKQVSPTEAFVSEERIDSLRASLPEGPFGESLLPGRSFFDLCAQAFPVGRVVLREHFRCAPEIIHFSNSQFYHGRLNPLKLPTSLERMTPSIVDVFVRHGRKVGKINEAECEAIVKMIGDMVSTANPDSPPKSIGVICMIGAEQSRLIRGRLLDVIGPKKYREHGVAVGEPPAFQGAERDAVFLSMVCSPGRVPTQNQLMHDQRANVAMSRARHRLVLVRSLGRGDVSNQEDAKIPILDFFARYGSRAADGGDGCEARARIGASHDMGNGGHLGASGGVTDELRTQVMDMIATKLRDDGFSVQPMGVVWNGAICVEHTATGMRAAISVEGGGEMKEEWEATISQQRSIERVGWHCLRVDALSWILDHTSEAAAVMAFLDGAGVEASEEIEITNEDRPDGAVDGSVPHLERNVAVDHVLPQAQAEINIDDESESGGNVGDAISALSDWENDCYSGECWSRERNEANPKHDGAGADLHLDDNCASQKKQSHVNNDNSTGIQEDQENEPGHDQQHNNKRSLADVVVISSSDEENMEVDRKPAASAASTARTSSESNSVRIDDGAIFPEQHSVLQHVSSSDRARASRRRSHDNQEDKREGNKGSHGEVDYGICSNERSSKRRKRLKQRRLDSYSRDGRWYPDRSENDQDEQLEADDWSDLLTGDVPTKIVAVGNSLALPGRIQQQPSANRSAQNHSQEEGEKKPASKIALEGSAFIDKGQA